MTGHSWLTAREVAEQIKLTEDYVTRQCAAGLLAAAKVGNVWRIDQADVDEFMDRRRPKQADPGERLTPAQRKGVERRRLAGKGARA